MMIMKGGKMHRGPEAEGNDVTEPRLSFTMTSSGREQRLVDHVTDSVSGEPIDNKKPSCR